MIDIEHLNIVVADPHRSAEFLTEVFGWHVRWSGDAIDGGTGVHVGTDDTYIALTSRRDMVAAKHRYPTDRPGLAHVGVLVDDLEATLERVHGHGVETFNHNDVAPGRRFYFFDGDDICWEVASYGAPT